MKSLRRQKREIKCIIEKKISNISPKFGENNKPADPKYSTKLKQKKYGKRNYTKAHHKTNDKRTILHCQKKTCVQKNKGKNERCLLTRSNIILKTVEKHL